MIGLDTNVLVRYLADDDPIQSPLAADLIERRLSAGSPGFVSLVAAAELVWVLERAYGFTSAKIAGAIERLLQADLLVVEAEQQVFAAMTALKSGEAAFSDALIGALGERAGCSHTATFDRKASRLASFELL